MHFDLDKLDVENFKFDYIYLNLDEIERNKKEHKLQFYYDDYLGSKFDETNYDYLIFPFYEDPRLIEHPTLI